MEETWCRWRLLGNALKDLKEVGGILFILDACF